MMAAMNWVIYGIIAAVALAAADVLVKVAAGKLPSSLGMLLYGVVPFLAGLIWFIVDLREKGMPKVPGSSVAAGLGVGVTFALVTFALYAAFEKGAPISVASPLIRLGGLLLASAVGIMIWKEPLALRYVMGMVLACSGIYLIVMK